jgi:Shikimate kinase
VVGKQDGLDRPRPSRVRLVTYRADGARIGLARGDRWIVGVGSKRTVARLAADARVHVVLTRFGDIGVTLDAGELASVDRRVRGDLQECAGAITTEPTVVCRDEQRPQDREDHGGSREYRGQTQQVLVRSEWRHDADALGKRGAAHPRGSCLDFSRSLTGGANFSAEARKIEPFDSPALAHGERLMIVVLMGAAGAGKTTVGKALAKTLGWTFVDADDLHPASNVDKMRAGMPLTDDDREPWLASTHEVIATLARDGRNAVVACSALRTLSRHPCQRRPRAALGVSSGGPRPACSSPARALRPFRRSSDRAKPAPRIGAATRRPDTPGRSARQHTD